MGRFLLTPALILFSTTSVFCQTLFWTDDFESAGPTGGARLPSWTGGSGGPPANTRYFKQTTLAGIALQPPGYAGIQGSQCWAGEDIDAAPTGASNEQSSEQHVLWADIDISGKIGLSFEGLFATTLSTVWDHGTSTTIADYCVVEYRIDAGPWTPLIAFRPNSANLANGALAIDSNLDGLGDGTALNNVFTSFSASITGTGTLLQLRCLVSSNSLAEEVAFDDFRLFSATSLPVELTSFLAGCGDGYETVSWTSESETLFDIYLLEGSEGGLSFTTLTEVIPKGGEDQSAHYSVSIPLAETMDYYRLNMRDLNGSSRYSPIISSKHCMADRLLQSFVVESDRLTCTFRKQGLVYELRSVTGAPAIRRTETGSETEHTVRLSAATGVYLLEVSDTGGMEREVYRIFVP